MANGENAPHPLIPGMRKVGITNCSACWTTVSNCHMYLRNEYELGGRCWYVPSIQQM